MNINNLESLLNYNIDKIYLYNLIIDIFGDNINKEEKNILILLFQAHLIFEKSTEEEKNNYLLLINKKIKQYV